MMIRSAPSAEIDGLMIIVGECPPISVTPTFTQTY